MAATHGRLTGRPGVCMATLGPGALNLVTGAAYAHLGAMPMILITGQKAIMSSRQARFQIVDMVATMRPLDQVVAPDRQHGHASRPSCATRSGWRRRSGRGRCIWSCPRTSPARRRRDLPLVPPHPIELPVAPPAALDRAAAMILAAEAAAGDARRRRQPPAADRRSDRVHPPHPDPVLQHADGQGHGVRRGGHNLYLGTAALSERDYVHEAIDRADLILAIGHDTVEKPPFLMGPDGPQVIHVGYTPANVEQVYFPHAEVVGDVGPEPGTAGRPARGQAAETASALAAPARGAS